MRPFLRLANNTQRRLFSSTPSQTFRFTSTVFTKTNMPIATSQSNGNANGAMKDGGWAQMEWLAAKDVTVEFGGQANVDYLKRVSFDFSSTPLLDFI